MRAFRSSLRQQCSFPPFEPWDNKIFPFFLRSALRILGLFYYAGFDVILIITKRNREIFKDVNNSDSCILCLFLADNLYSFQQEFSQLC